MWSSAARGEAKSRFDLVENQHQLLEAIAEHVILEYGVDELLTRLSDPFWFQAYGAVMGMDWHSSGITTSVMRALKRGLNPRAADLGLLDAAGRHHQHDHPDRGA